MINVNGITLVRIGRLSISVADFTSDLTILWRGFWVCIGPREPIWGWREDWYDGPIHQLGAGHLVRFGMYDFLTALEWD